MKLITTALIAVQLLLVQTACNFAVPNAAPEGAVAPGHSAYKMIAGEVVGVTDGDTLTLLDQANTQHRIRLAGIDAPESSQDYGQAAKKNLSTLVFGKQVEIRYEKLDRYGRILGAVIYGGRDINLAQIEGGFAWHYKEYENEQAPEDRAAYADAEERARRERRGLWQQPNPVKPSDYRRSKRVEP